jgi:hypothetical protein
LWKLFDVLSALTSGDVGDEIVDFELGVVDDVE